MPSVLYAADVVCSMTGPPLADGGVLVEGDRIVEVGSRGPLARRADRTYEVRGALLPGLVNASTLCEYADGETPADDWSRAARRGVQQLLHAGVTAAGDVVVHGPAVPAACRAGLHGDSYVRVAYADGTHADSVVAQVEHALGLPAEGRRVGIAPLSPTVLSTGLLRALGVLAQRTGVPLQVAAGQTSGEVAALRSGDGPVAERARELGLAFEWLDGGTGLSPVRYLDECGVLGPRTSVVHAVHVDVLEARLLAARGATVICAPRSELPLERYAQAGTKLALGTGPLADPDPLAAATVWVAMARARDLAVWPSASGPVPLEEQAVRLATADGAAALGWGGFAGLLEPGRRADLTGIALDITAATAYRDLIDRGAGNQVLTVLAGVHRARGKVD